MLLTPHLLVGGALATSSGNIPMALTLAFLSHYILDAVPHWDYLVSNIRVRNWPKALPDFSKICLDFFAGLILILLLAKEPILALAGAFFAVLPDAVSFFTILFPENYLLKKHDFLHDKICHWFRSKKIHLLWKFASQIVIGTLSILMIL